MGLAQAGDSICLRHRSAAVDGGQVLTSLRLGAAEEEVLASFRSVVGAVVVSPTAVATPTAAPTPSVEPSPTGTPPSITPSATPVSTPTTIPSLRPSPTPTLLPGPTASPSPTPSITPVLNLPPQAADDVFELELFLVEGDNTARLDVLANDRDPEGASLRIVSVEQALSGLVDIIEEGAALRFTAATATIRELNLAYVLSDGQNTARAEVQLRIASPSFAVLPAVMVDALQDSVGTNGAAILLSCVTRTDSIEQPADAILDLEAVPAVRLFEAGVNFSRLPQRFLVRAVPSAATVAEPICVQLLYELQGVDPEAGDQGRREIPWFNAGGLQSPAQSFEPLVDPQTLLRLPRFDAPELSRNGFEQQIVAENSGEAVVRIQPGEDREQPLRVRLRSLRFAPGYQPPGAPGAAATAGQDYQPVDVELFWEAGDAEARTLRLPLSTEDGLEGEEFLVLAITEIHFAAPGVEASASVGPQSVLALSLRDADTLRFDPAVCFVEEGGSQQVLLTRDMVVGGPLQVRLFDQA
ncbi:MAG: Ig-like domain-containing protein, partial [Oceanococcaceae bacterium]